MCKKITLAMIIVSIFAVPVMADVAVNVSWNNPTPNVNVLWASQAGGIWTGAQGSVSVWGAGTAADGLVTFNTTNDSHPVASSLAEFAGGTYEASVNYSTVGGIFNAANSSYSKFELGNAANWGGLYQGFQATSPVETTGGQNVSAGDNATRLTMEQYISGDTIGTVSFHGEASGSVRGDASQALDLFPNHYGAMGARLAGTTGPATVFNISSTLPNTTVVVGATFSGVGPWGTPYGTTNPAYSVIGETQNVADTDAGWQWLAGYIEHPVP
jgi:hypothetical protein